MSFFFIPIPRSGRGIPVSEKVMAAGLTQLEQELQEIRHRTERLVSGLMPEQLTYRPDPFLHSERSEESLSVRKLWQQG